VFARLIEEYGNVEEDNAPTKLERRWRKGGMHSDSDDSDKEDTKSNDSHGTLIQAEERVTGTVASATYVNYFRFAGSVFWVPLIVFLMLSAQAASRGFLDMTA